MENIKIGTACIANTLYTPHTKWLNVLPYECRFIANIEEEIEEQKACIVAKYDQINECLQYLIVIKDLLIFMDGGKNENI